MKQAWHTFENREAIDDKPLGDGNPNPVKQYDNGWYFYDEAWASCYGPFYNELDCKAAYLLYAAILSGKDDGISGV